MLDVPEGVNRRWLIASRPDVSVGPENFRWVEAPIPTPGEGQVLVRNLWLSMDPTNVLYAGNGPDSGGAPLGAIMQGQACSQVIASRLARFQPGELLQGFAGWEDYSVTDGHGFIETTKVPAGVSPNLALGTLGTTGMAAYFGVVDAGKPRKGETFVISAAAGGVGSIAGQIARILGLRVIGIAGSKTKCDWLVGEAGFAAAIDYRSEDVPARLSSLCPGGIDIYFDNVGDVPTLDAVLSKLRTGGRVVLCGLTSWYLAKEAPPGPRNFASLIMANGRIQGVLARDYFDRFPEAVAAMRGWLESGELRSKEEVLVGLENAPAALARMFSRENLGKQLLKIADPRPS